MMPQDAYTSLTTQAPWRVLCRPTPCFIPIPSYNHDDINLKKKRQLLKTKCATRPHLREYKVQDCQDEPRDSTDKLMTMWGQLCGALTNSSDSIDGYTGARPISSSRQLSSIVLGPVQSASLAFGTGSTVRSIWFLARFLSLIFAHSLSPRSSSLSCKYLLFQSLSGEPICLPGISKTAISLVGNARLSNSG